MRIRAALLTAPGRPFEIETLDLEGPRSGEVRVKIAATGVCHSDQHVRSGETRHPMPCVAGHEGAGTVEEVGPGVTRVKPGDPVTLSWAPDCGECFYCLRDRPNLCDTFKESLWAGVMLDGSTRLSWQGQPVYHYCGLATFAEHAVVPEQSCVPIPHHVPLEVAALVGCAVATGVGAVLNTAAVQAGESVVVYGAGGVGLNILQGAALCGASPIIAVDTHPDKMASARRFGATHTLMNDDSTLAAIRDLTGGRGADHAFESVGRPELQEAALVATRRGGTVTLVGLSPMGSHTNLPGAVITREEKVIQGSYYGSVNPRRDFPRLIDLYLAGKLALDELISREYSLEDINEAHDAMLTGGIARAVIVF